MASASTITCRCPASVRVPSALTRCALLHRAAAQRLGMAIWQQLPSRRAPTGRCAVLRPLRRAAWPSPGWRAALRAPATALLLLLLRACGRAGRMLLRAPGAAATAGQRTQRAGGLDDVSIQRLQAVCRLPVGRQRKRVRPAATQAGPIKASVAATATATAAAAQHAAVAAVAAPVARAGLLAGGVAGLRAVQQAGVHLEGLPSRHIGQHVKKLLVGARGGARRRHRRHWLLGGLLRLLLHMLLLVIQQALLAVPGSRRQRQRRGRLLAGGAVRHAGRAGAAHPPLQLGRQLRRAVEHILTELQVGLNLRQVGRT